MNTWRNFKSWFATIPIFLCAFIGTLLTWSYLGNWFAGAYYGCAVGCGIYAAAMSDDSPKEPRHPL